MTTTPNYGLAGWISADSPPPYGKRVVLQCQWERQGVAVLIGRRDHTDRDGEHYENDDGGAVIPKVYWWQPLPEPHS